VYPEQSFLVSLDLVPARPPADREVFYKNETMHFLVTPERAAHILLIGIDRKGWVTIIYPVGRPQTTAQTSMRTEEFKVAEPFGLETVKVFAFAEEPAGYAGLSGRGRPFSPLSGDFRALLDVVRGAVGGKAEFSRLLYTSGVTQPEK
jgi:hypothetical protein